jgi:hypothetical protein
MKTKSMLDPVLAGALELERLPVLSGRADMVLEAELLTGALERIGAKASIEGDRRAAGQLLNIAESLGVMVISLVAYSRGRTPQVASQKPNTNIIVQ